MDRIVPLAALLLAAGLAAAQDGYRLVPTDSDVHWRIYSAGALRRFGHNHVISAGAIAGGARTANGEIDFTIEIPADELVVDDPELRALYGEQFASEPSPDDIAGTRRNMLGEEVLDAERHPVLTVSGRGPLRDAEEVTLDLTVEVAGRTAQVRVPVTVRLDPGGLSAEGGFALTHAELGLEPFRALLGGLKVAERIDFTYRIRAERIAP